MFFGEKDIIIDPTYANLAAYRKTYDYDLLGHPIGLGRDFLHNPVGYIRQQWEAYKLVVLTAGFYLIAVIVSIYLFKRLVLKALRYVKTFLKMRSEAKNAKAQNKRRGEFRLPKRLDLNALAFYRTFASHYNIRSGNSAALLPDDEEDYEDLRFALEAAWPTGLGLKALDEEYSLSDVNDEPIEGQLQDEILEEYLRQIQERIAKEKARYGYRPPEQKVAQPSSAEAAQSDEAGLQEEQSLSGDEYFSEEDDDFDIHYDYNEDFEEWGFICRRKSSSRISLQDDIFKRAVENEYQRAVHHMYDEDEPLVNDELPVTWKVALEKAEDGENIGDIGPSSDYYVDTQEHQLENLRIQAPPEDEGLDREVREARRRLRMDKGGE